MQSIQTLVKIYNKHEDNLESQVISKYSGDLNTGLVWYLNGKSKYCCLMFGFHIAAWKPDPKKQNVQKPDS